MKGGVTILALGPGRLGESNHFSFDTPFGRLLSHASMSEEP